MLRKLLKKLDRKLLFGFLELLYRFFLIKKNAFFLKNYSNLKTFKRKINHDNFSKLCEKYNTDKGGINYGNLNRKFHFYSVFYDEYFKNKKNEIRLVFECGIGSPNKSIQSNTFGKGYPGASLKVLKEYFSNANIYGADIDREILFKEERINTFYVDQLNKQSINKMWDEIGKTNFDIMIDDGLHMFEASYNFFVNSYPHLKNNGLYIIEDVHIAYLKKLANKLKKYKPSIITSDNKSLDDYLIVIQKN